MKKTIEQVHRASQWLAKAGKFLLKQKPDDSNTNLGWDESKNHVTGRRLKDNKKMRLHLDLNDFSLNVYNEEEERSGKFPLNGKNDVQAKAWLQEIGSDFGIKKKVWGKDLHYELPYSNDETTYNVNEKEGKQLAEILSAAKGIISSQVERIGDASEIRIWPHHFDIAALVAQRFEDETLVASVGVGLAIPDGMIDGLYIYVSPWKKSGIKVVDAPDLPEPARWITDGWLGAATPLLGWERPMLLQVKSDEFLAVVSRAVDQAKAMLDEPKKGNVHIK